MAGRPKYHPLNFPGFFKLLREVENPDKVGRSNIGRWDSHKSPEGGNRTIAYGHKLTDEEVISGKLTIAGKEVDWTKGITDRQADDLLVQDVVRKQKKAQAEFNKHKPLGDDVTWKDLPDVARLGLTEIAFNTGGLQDDKGAYEWPKLTKALYLGDPSQIKAQAHRKGDAKTQPGLDKRVSTIASYLVGQLNEPASRFENLTDTQLHKVFIPDQLYTVQDKLYEDVGKLDGRTVVNMKAATKKSLMDKLLKKEPEPSVQVNISGATVDNGSN